MEPDWSTFTEPPPPKQRTFGSKVAIGIGASLLVWFAVDVLESLVGPWVVGALVVIGLGFALRGNAAKRSQQVQILLIVAACLVGWVLLVFFFSLFSYWIIILLTAGLAGVVFYKEWHHKRRQRWLDQGCCAACGYDLRASPGLCPECGRDQALDEPTWRKLRREWGNIKPVDDLPEPAAEDPPAVIRRPVVPTVMKTPDFIDGPILLEEVAENPKSETPNPKA